VTPFLARAEADSQTTILSEPLPDDAAARSVTFLTRLPPPVVGAGAEPDQMRGTVAAGRVLGDSAAADSQTLLFRVVC
jgi:hypothetical protein